MKRRFYLLSALLVISAFALTGCGGKKENTDPASSNEPSVSQDAPEEIPDTSEAPDEIEVEESEDIPEVEVDFDDL